MDMASSSATVAPDVLLDHAAAAANGSAEGLTRSEVAPVRAIIKKQGIRKRKRPDANGDSDDSEGDDEAARREKLALLRDLREDQKRAKARGLDPEALAQGDLIGQAEEAKRAAKVAAAAAAEEAIGQYGLKAVAVGGGKSEFGSGFTAETGIDSKDDPLLRAYIAQRLQEMQAAGGASAAAAAAVVGPQAGASLAAPSTGTSGSGGSNDELKRLYEMPDELRPVERSERRDADMGEGGMLLAGTGITEVALPEAFRARNEAATQAAMVGYLERRAVRGAAAVALSLGAGQDAAKSLRGGGSLRHSAAAAAAGGAGAAAAAVPVLPGEGDDDAVTGLAPAAAAAGSSAAAGRGDRDGGGRDGGIPPPRFIVGNLSSNFKLHGREFAQKMRDGPGAGGGGGGAGGGGGRGGHHHHHHGGGGSGGGGGAGHLMMQRSGYGSVDGSALSSSGGGIGGVMAELAAGSHGHGHGHRGSGSGAAGGAGGAGGSGPGSYGSGPADEPAGAGAPAPAAAAAARREPPPPPAEPGAYVADDGWRASYDDESHAPAGDDRSGHHHRREGGGRGGGGGGGGRGGYGRGGHGRASDDVMFNQFRKREIASLRNK